MRLKLALAALSILLAHVLPAAAKSPQVQTTLSAREFLVHGVRPKILPFQAPEELSWRVACRDTVLLPVRLLKGYLDGILVLHGVVEQKDGAIEIYGRVAGMAFNPRQAVFPASAECRIVQ